MTEYKDNKVHIKRRMGRIVGFKNKHSFKFQVTTVHVAELIYLINLVYNVTMVTHICDLSCISDVYILFSRPQCFPKPDQIVLMLKPRGWIKCVDYTRQTIDI